LLHAEVSQYRVTVSSLCEAAHVPATTALRYITTMTDSGLLMRRADPSDGRRIFMELTPHASDALHHYFASLKAAAEV
jgi:DNA-binding MarR family transcriptional regulator